MESPAVTHSTTSSNIHEWETALTAVFGKVDDHDLRQPGGDPHIGAPNAFGICLLTGFERRWRHGASPGRLPDADHGYPKRIGQGRSAPLHGRLRPWRGAVHVERRPAAGSRRSQPALQAARPGELSLEGAMMGTRRGCPEGLPDPTAGWRGS